MLTQKYGRPAKVEEKFTGSAASLADSNRTKWMFFNSGDYIWYTIYNTPKGRIELRMLHKEYNYTAYVLLKYIDKINNETVRAAAIDDL